MILAENARGVFTKKIVGDANGNILSTLPSGPSQMIDGTQATSQSVNANSGTIKKTAFDEYFLSSNFETLNPCQIIADDKVVLTANTITAIIMP